MAKPNELPGTNGPDVLERGVDISLISYWWLMTHAYDGDDVINVYASPWGQDYVNSIEGVKADGTPNVNYQYYQRHVYAGAGDDQINMIFGNYTGDETLRLGHHAYGDTGSDVFNFQNVNNIPQGQTVVGRIDDFDASRDKIQIDGVDLDLHNLPANVRVVSYNGNYFDDEARWQQWLLIENNQGGHVFYALEGARSDFYEWGHDETHFIREVPDFDTLADVVFEDVHAAVPYSAYKDLPAEKVIEYYNRDHAMPMAVNTGYGKLFTEGSADASMIDVIHAGAGYDYVFAEAGDDLIAGGNSTDYLYGGDGNDQIWGGTEDDEIYGGAGADGLQGDYGADLVSGGAGSDLLYGNEDDDVIFGDNVVDDYGKVLSVAKFDAFVAANFAGIDSGVRDFTVNGAWVARPVTVLDNDHVLQDNNNDAITGQSLDASYQLTHNDYRGVLEGAYIYSRGYYEVQNVTTGETGRVYQIRVDANYDGTGAPGMTAEYYAPTKNLTFSLNDEVKIIGNLNALGDVDYDVLGEILTGPETASGFDTIFGGLGDDRLIGGNGDDQLLGGAGNDVIYGDNAVRDLDKRFSLEPGDLWDVYLLQFQEQKLPLYAGQTITPIQDWSTSVFTIIDDDAVFDSGTSTGSFSILPDDTSLQTYQRPANDLNLTPWTLPGIEPELLENAYFFVMGYYYAHNYDTLFGPVGGPIYKIGIDFDHIAGTEAFADAEYYVLSPSLTYAPGEELTITQDFVPSDADTVLYYEDFAFLNVSQSYGPNVTATGDDVIYGEDGHDVIYGGVANDEIYGGDGHDTLYGGLGNDDVYGDAGNDTLYGGLDPNDGPMPVNANLVLNVLQGNGNNLDNLAWQQWLDPTDSSWWHTEFNIYDDDLNLQGIEINTAHGDIFDLSEQYFNIADPAYEVTYTPGEVSHAFITGYYEAHDDVTQEAGRVYILAVDYGFASGTTPENEEEFIVLSSNFDINNGHSYSFDSDFIAINSVAYEDLDRNELWSSIGTTIDGSDNLYGGAGTDRFEILQNTGFGDKIYGGDGRDTISYQYLNNRTAGTYQEINLNLGSDSYGNSIAEIENVVGSRFADRIWGNNDANRLEAALGNDVVYGLGGNDVMYGGEGVDYLIGGNGNDYAQGGNGNDFLYGQNDHDRLYGEAGVDRIFGGNGNDQGYGGADNDYVYGGIGVDKLYGDAGNDYMRGDADNDYSYGGDGNDRVYGGDGNDLLYGGNQNDYGYGGNGTDRVFGDAGNDFLYGDADGDFVYGGDGADRLYGGDGNDWALGGNHNDLVYGGNGTDRVYGQNGDDRVYGDAGNDFTYGDAGNDYIYGGLDHDQVYGGVGNDYAYGDAGNDYVRGDAGNDVVYGGDGADRVCGDDGNDWVIGGNDNDRAYGGAGSDRVYGQNGNDLLYGDAGNDSIYGGNGNDVILGGTGNDLLYGGAGADVFKFFNAEDAIDRIADFEHGIDKIDLSSVAPGEYFNLEQTGAHVTLKMSIPIEDASPLEFDIALFINSNVNDFTIDDFIYG